MLHEDDTGSNWLRDALTAHPMALGLFMTTLSTLGLFVMMYVTNIRCDVRDRHHAGLTLRVLVEQEALVGAERLVDVSNR